MKNKVNQWLKTLLAGKNNKLLYHIFTLNNTSLSFQKEG
jgi:hypothetical protein